MPMEKKYNRRSFLGTAAMSLGAAELAMIGLGKTQFTNENKREVMKSKYKRQPSFGPLKQVDAGLLNVGYAEEGPLNGFPVILLHGWPYDIHSFVEVVPLLTS